MQRYFVLPEQIREGRVTIKGGDAHHIARVMRYKAGDVIIVCDNTGRELSVQLEHVRGNAVTGRVTTERTAMSEPRLRVTLAQSLLKGDKFDWVVQKGTEMGVYQFWPFHAERSVVRLSDSKAAKRRERWHKIAKEAAEQARRGRIPEVCAPVRWHDVLNHIPLFDVAVIPHERERNQSLPSLWQSLSRVETCLIIVGPEGGFEAEEVNAAQQAGAYPVYLGPRILRAETAALTTIACTMWAGGEMEVTAE